MVFSISRCCLGFSLSFLVALSSSDNDTMSFHSRKSRKALSLQDFFNPLKIGTVKETYTAHSKDPTSTVGSAFSK